MMPTVTNPTTALAKKSSVSLASLLNVSMAQAYLASLNDSLSVRATGCVFFSNGVLIICLVV